MEGGDQLDGAKGDNEQETKERYRPRRPFPNSCFAGFASLRRYGTTCSCHTKIPAAFDLTNTTGIEHFSGNHAFTGVQLTWPVLLAGLEGAVAAYRQWAELLLDLERRLYLATRSHGLSRGTGLDAAGVLSNSRSEMVVSGVSPERWETMV